MHLEAKLEHAEREAARLGTQADPFLDFLLRQFAEQALHLASEGEAGVNLLYHSWVGSGLAREGYEARLTLWENGAPDAELRLSDLADPPESAYSLSSPHSWIPRPARSSSASPSSRTCTTSSLSR